MKFGVCVTQVSEVGLAVEAEQQGYDFCWVWDSPMIRSNVWALLALIADKTNRIAVGSGVAVPGLAMARPHDRVCDDGLYVSRRCHHSVGTDDGRLVLANRILSDVDDVRAQPRRHKLPG